MKLHINRKNRKRIQRFIGIALAMCLMVSTGSSYVSAETADGGAKSHAHTEACYEEVYITDSEGQGEDSYERVLVCGYGDADMAVDTAAEGEELDTDVEAGIIESGVIEPDTEAAAQEAPDIEASSQEAPEVGDPDGEVFKVEDPDAGDGIMDPDIAWADLSELEALPANAVGAAMWLAAPLSLDDVTDTGWSFDAYYTKQDDLYDVTLTSDFNLKYQMEFHASRNFAAGQVRIRINAGIFKDRDGNLVLPSEVGVPQGTLESPTSNRSTPFNYYYEGEGENRVLVFFNYKAISSGANAAWQVLYKDQKLMDIIDETEWRLTPQISADGGYDYTSTQSLTGRVNSWVFIDSVSKSYYSKSGLNYTPGLYTLAQVQQYIDGEVDGEFLNEDGRLNTTDWRYVVWDVKVEGTATQPWNMIITDMPSASGKVVGYKDNSDKTTTYKLPIGKVGADGTALTNQREESWGNRFYVVTAYPAASVGDGTKVSNDITIRLVPADGIDAEAVLDSNTATWTYVDYDWSYRGNVIGIQKTTDKTVYTGWLDAYRLSGVKGEDYGDMPFTTTGHMYGYSYTHRIESSKEGSAYTIGDYIPGTYYTLTTVDDFMYLYAGDGESAIMGKDDYYFSGVTITQTDYGYDVWEDEQRYSELADTDPDALPAIFKKDGDTVGSEVRIYAMLANPSDANARFADKDGWVLIDTVSMDGTGRMTPYSFTDDVIAQQPWRVKVEHDTIDYETICKIDVTVRIKADSPKMKEILAEREDAETNEKSPEVKFENISGVVGKVHVGNNVQYLTEIDGAYGSQNYSELGLAEATQNLYKDNSGNGILLIRDNAYRTVTWLNETAASFKNAKSTNDVDNNRVLVDYYLTAYDGYEIYNRDSLDYLRAEDQELISPGRTHVVFYDLLPYGMQFDASSPVTAGRITNLSNDTYQTQPRSWDSTQVAVTVDPESDIITNYRGTGRTMVVFHVSFSGADSTSYTNGKWIEGWGVSFRAYYDWKDIDQLNHVEINANLSAFMPDFSELSGGSNTSHPALVGLRTEVDYDDGSHGDTGALLAEIDRAYTDMVRGYVDENGNHVRGNIDGYNLKDENGNSYDTTYRNVLYAKNVLTDDVATSSQSTIEKLVRADVDRFGAFDRTAYVPAREDEDGFYTYDLTVTTATGIEDIVIFDRLERAAIDRKGTNDPFVSEFKDNTWSGTFQSLDASGLEILGISYTVYYSENTNAQITESSEVPESVLTAANGWYTEEAFQTMLESKYGESQDSAYSGRWQDYVRAVAVQLNGYTLEANHSVSFRIKMKAPLVRDLEDGSSLSTYNNASFSSVAVNDGTRSTVTGNSVKVTISEEETLEIIKKTSSSVPAARQDENFEFRLYEEYTYENADEKQYLAYTEYSLYKLTADGEWELQEGLHATDGSGYLYLHADEKAVFDMAEASRIQVEETESVFWASEMSEQVTSEADGQKPIRTLTVTNTYRPVLYVQKNLSAVPDGVDVSEASFTFKIEIKRNDTYVPLADAEFWYVDSARLDGGIPEKLSSGVTAKDGTFTIRKDDIIALFPGVAGTEYRVSEVIGVEEDEETGSLWDWVCETDSVTGTLITGGSSKSITNYYRWKDLLLTKDITHQTQEDYDKDPQAFTFSISEVAGEDEDGNEILLPMAGTEWVLLDEDGNEIAETSGVLDKEGIFTCTMGFRTVKIKGLEAGKTYRIEELTEGISKEDGKPLYVPAEEGSVTTTMPVYSTRRNVTVTNDYQKRPLSVTKTVVGSSDDSGLGDGGNNVKYFRFTVTVNGEELPEGTPYTVTSMGETVTRYVGVMPEGDNVSFAGGSDVQLSEKQFVLADGETAVFKDVGMLGDELVVTEVDNAYQIYPADREAYETVLSGDGAEVSFVNGEAGSLLIRKEYVGLDEIGNSQVEELKNSLTYLEDGTNSLEEWQVEFVLTITDSEGTYVWPEMPVTVQCIEKNGTLGERSFEPGDSITIDPWVTIIIPTGDDTSIPSNATYTLTETEESRNRMVLYHNKNDYEYKYYWLQISQSAASDALGESKTVNGRPSATIWNEVSTIGSEDEGSWRGKLMTSYEEEVPDGKMLVWRVEKYDKGSGTWLPAGGVSYAIFKRGFGEVDAEEAVSRQIETTNADGRIILYKPDGNYYPYVWFPKDSVYLNLYAEADINRLLENGKTLLRLVEVPEESDDEWGMLVGYMNKGGMPPYINNGILDDGGGNTMVEGTPGGGMLMSLAARGLDQAVPKNYSMDLSPEYADNFVNSNSKTTLEIEKYMASASDTLFTMILEQVVSVSPLDNGMITSNNYAIAIAATRPGAGIPYTVYNADGSRAGSGVTGSGGEIQLEAGQYASLEVSDGTMWLVSEKTTATPNFKLKDLQPESGDERMIKLNDNLMLINLGDNENPPQDVDSVLQ